MRWFRMFDVSTVGRQGLSSFEVGAGPISPIHTDRGRDHELDVVDTDAPTSDEGDNGSGSGKREAGGLESFVRALCEGGNDFRRERKCQPLISTRG